MCLWGARGGPLRVWGPGGSPGNLWGPGGPSGLGYGDWNPLDRGRAIGALWGCGRGPHNTVQWNLCIITTTLKNHLLNHLLNQRL